LPPTKRHGRRRQIGWASDGPKKRNNYLKSVVLPITVSALQRASAVVNTMILTWAGSDLGSVLSQTQSLLTRMLKLVPAYLDLARSSLHHIPCPFLCLFPRPFLLCPLMCSHSHLHPTHNLRVRILAALFCPKPPACTSLRLHYAQLDCILCILHVVA
jgi:hypothetical protein